MAKSVETRRKSDPIRHQQGICLLYVELSLV